MTILQPLISEIESIYVVNIYSKEEVAYGIINHFSSCTRQGKIALPCNFTIAIATQKARYKSNKQTKKT